MSMKNLNNRESSTPLDTLILNLDHEMNTIHLIWNGEDPYPLEEKGNMLYVINGC